MSDCPSQLVLAAFHTGDLNETQQEETTCHLRECHGCQRALETLKENAGMYEQQMSRHQVALKQALVGEAEVAANKKKQGAVMLLFGIKNFRWVVPVAAAAAVLIVVLASATLMQPSAPLPDMAYKGQFSVSVVARRNRNQFAVDEGARLRENDALRFTIQTGKPGYLVIGDLDSRGQFTVLYPAADSAAEGQALEIRTPGRHTLPDSIVLDDATGEEHFVTIFSKTPFKTDLIDLGLAKKLIENDQLSGGSPSMLPNELPAPLQDAIINLLTIQKE
jgi:hypothetical protein